MFSLCVVYLLFARAEVVFSSAIARTWSKDVIRIVCISDTHSLEAQMQPIPAGDVLIHAGDFSNVGTGPEVYDFVQFVKQKPHPQKIVIAGNHDITLQPKYYRANGHRFHPHLFQRETFDPLAYSQMCRDFACTSDSPAYTYLQDSSTVIRPPVDSSLGSPGIEVYGAPWQPEFYNWAFNLPPGLELKTKWDLIPSSTDVLITHGPPHMILDRLLEGDHTGCPELRDAVARVKPRLHIFGHIHEGYGTYFDGTTTFVNACTCRRDYQPSNPPIVIDLPLDPTLPARMVSVGVNEKDEL